MTTISIDTKVIILGSEWTVRSSSEQEEPRLEGKSAFTDWTSKLICLDRDVSGDLDDKKQFLEKIIRHEVIHACMFESGFGDGFEHQHFGQEESVVDWFAYQIPKIERVCKNIMEKILWGVDE